MLRIVAFDCPPKGRGGGGAGSSPSKSAPDIFMQDIVTSRQCLALADVCAEVLNLNTRVLANAHPCSLF